jgi:hypothetical protein
MADAARKSPPLLTERFEILLPSVLPRAIKIAAERQLTTPSEYVRRSVIDRLRADGIDLLSVAA